MFELICETLRATAALGIVPDHGLSNGITPDMTLMDLGIDSLGAMTILSELSNQLSIQLDDFEFNDSLTLADLVQALTNAKVSHAS